MADTVGALLVGGGGFVGTRVGRKDMTSVPDTVGRWVESAIVGMGVGCFVGDNVGALVMDNGDCVGPNVGDEGLAEGESVGFMTGD